MSILCKTCEHYGGTLERDNQTYHICLLTSEYGRGRMFECTDYKINGVKS